MASSREFSDDGGEGGTVEVGVKGEEGGSTNLEDALKVLLGLKEVKGNATLLLQGERGGGVKGRAWRSCGRGGGGDGGDGGGKIALTLL